MEAQFVMNGDLIPIALKGDGVCGDLFNVTAVAWTADGSIQLFGYGLMGTHEGSLPVLPSNARIEVWSRGTLR